MCCLALDTGTASSLYKAQTINSLLHLGKNVEDFQESQKRISAQIKSEILSKFGDARILVIDEVSMLSPVMLAFINLGYVSVLTLNSLLGDCMLF